MGVTAVEMDVVTEKSGHTITPLAVSVCITPMVPPTPLPYPVVASVSEGISDTPMRTKIEGVGFATTGSVLKACHGNEPGTLKEVVSLNTTGPVFPIMGAPTVLSELVMISITGSPCVSNKAQTPRAGGNASDAGGSSSKGSGSGTDGSGDGKDKKADNEKGGGGADGDGTSSGATATPATPEKQNEYCPDKNRRNPPKDDQHLHDVDLRNHGAAIGQHASPAAKSMAMNAIHGVPGGPSGGKGQAFWSGGDPAMAAARRDGFVIQEDSGAAAHLAANDGTLLGDSAPGARDGWTRPQGTAQSPVTKDKLWRTVSRRSAEETNANTVEAYAVGSAAPGNVFSNVELPTLLHNPNVKQINFRNPKASQAGPPPVQAPIVETWTRDDATGCWHGNPTPTVDNGRGPVPGFKLDSTGVSRT